MKRFLFVPMLLLSTAAYAATYSGTATGPELDYVHGVTSAIQPQLDAKESASIFQNYTSGVSALKNTYNVKSYGAKCDGTTEDTSAYNAALLAAHNAGGGKVVGCPVSTLVSNTSTSFPTALTIYSNTTLEHLISAHITFRNDATIQSVGNMISNYAAYNPNRALTTVSTVAALATPAVPTSISVTGADGAHASTWTYVIASVDAKGGVTIASPSASTAAGATWATFNSTPTSDYNTVNFAACAGTNCYVYRTAVPAGGTTGYLGSVANGATSYADQTNTALTGSPLVNATTGAIITVSGADTFTSADLGRTLAVDNAGGNANGTSGKGILVGLVSKVISSTQVLITGLDGHLPIPASFAYAAGSPTTGRVYARDSNIKIIGGFWDRGYVAAAGATNGASGAHTLYFAHVDNLEYGNLSITNHAQKFHILTSDATDVRASNFSCTGYSDCFHMHGPINKVTVRDMSAFTCDDNFSITAAEYASYQDSAGDVSNVLVDGFRGVTGASHYKLVSGGPNGTYPNSYQLKLRNITLKNSFGMNMSKTYSSKSVSNCSVITSPARYYNDPGWYRITVTNHGFNNGDILTTAGFTPSTINTTRFTASIVDANTIDLLESINNGACSLSTATVTGGFSASYGIMASDELEGYLDIDGLYVENFDTDARTGSFVNNASHFHSAQIRKITNSLNDSSSTVRDTIQTYGADSLIVDGLYKSSSTISSSNGVHVSASKTLGNLQLSNSSLIVYGTASGANGVLLNIEGTLSDLNMSNTVAKTDGGAVDKLGIIVVAGGSATLSRYQITNSSLSNVTNILQSYSAGAVVGPGVWTGTTIYNPDRVFDIRTTNTVNVTLNGFTYVPVSGAEQMAYVSGSGTLLNIRGTGYVFKNGGQAQTVGIQLANSGTAKVYHDSYPPLAPSIACTTSSPTLSTGSSDMKGVITIGAGTVTTCTLTFAQPFLNTPACNVSGTVAVSTVTPSTTSLIFTGTALGSGTVSYRCDPINE